MKCANCGAENQAGQLFCSDCGSKLESNKRRQWIFLSIGVLVVLLVALVVVLVVILGTDTSTEQLVLQVKPTADREMLTEVAKIARERLAAGGIKVEKVKLTAGNRINVSIDKKSVEEAKRLLRGGIVQFRIVLDAKSREDILKDPALRNDPSWKASAGEALRPDAPITLPLETNGKTEMLKLGETEMTGAEIRKAEVAVDSGGRYKIAFAMTGGGSKDLAAITEANRNKRLAIVVDYKAISAPYVKEPIRDGAGDITGKFSKSEATELTVKMAYYMPAELDYIGVQK